MSFVDRAKIVIKSGDGGDGCSSFHREKFVHAAARDGGDGGNGGNVVLFADAGMNTLLDFKFARFYRAQNGESGRSKLQRGKNGDDLVIKVPVGTIVKDISSGKIIADMNVSGKTRIVLHGGRGGKGNARLPHHKSKPKFSQPGQKTLEHEIELELKRLPIVGLIGIPNVGKSTILSVLLQTQNRR